MTLKTSNGQWGKYLKTKSVSLIVMHMEISYNQSIKPTPLSQCLTIPSTQWPVAKGSLCSLKLPVLGFISGCKHTLLTWEQRSRFQARWIEQLALKGLVGYHPRTWATIAWTFSDSMQEEGPERIPSDRTIIRLQRLGWWMMTRVSDPVLMSLTLSWW